MTPTDRAMVREWLLLAETGHVAWSTEKLRDVCRALLEAWDDLSAIRSHMDEQAEDEALWLIETRIETAYIQQELRKLHATIEQHTCILRQARRPDELEKE